MKSIYRSIDNSMHEPFECDLCDGCGWYEGGKTLVTTCTKCNGKGVIDKIILCSNPHSWEDGKEYEEGKDYEVASRANGFFVKGSYSNKCVYCGNVFHNTDKLWFCCEDCSNQMIASPLSSNDEDELWEEIEQIITTECWKSTIDVPQMVELLKSKFHITKKL